MKYCQGYILVTDEVASVLNTLGANPKVKVESHNGWDSTIDSFNMPEKIFNKYFIYIEGTPEYPAEIQFKNEETQPI